MQCLIHLYYSLYNIPFYTHLKLRVLYHFLSCNASCIPSVYQLAASPASWSSSSNSKHTPPCFITDNPLVLHVVPQRPLTSPFRKGTDLKFY
uniref:Uncharacterized protein n=1 Tax=Pyxicephalus adspersus TaxID=30357 RepID=A0AAV3BAY0_PYXAD|nr:TPA: hypothetical protein GDO54_002110 [Pyxicephalus adspersus]